MLQQCPASRQACNLLYEKARDLQHQQVGQPAQKVLCRKQVERPLTRQGWTAITDASLHNWIGIACIHACMHAQGSCNNSDVSSQLSPCSTLCAILWCMARIRTCKPQVFACCKQHKVAPSHAVVAQAALTTAAGCPCNAGMPRSSCCRQAAVLQTACSCCSCLSSPAARQPPA